MTNVASTVEINRIRKLLVKSAYAVLDAQGWKVSRVKGRVLRITKNGKSKLAAIRTSRDTWIAFARSDDDAAWVTLSDVDVVVASSVDDPENPKFAQVHMFDAGEVRERFDRAYAARKAADHSIPLGRGVWVSLYRDEATIPVQRVGAGIGNIHPPIARVQLDAVGISAPVAPQAANPTTHHSDDIEPLTIAQAKARLARSLGVDPANIKITVEA